MFSDLQSPPYAHHSGHHRTTSITAATVTVTEPFFITEPSTVYCCRAVHHCRYCYRTVHCCHFRHHQDHPLMPLQPRSYRKGRRIPRAGLALCSLAYSLDKESRAGYQLLSSREPRFFSLLFTSSDYYIFVLSIYRYSIDYTMSLSAIPPTIVDVLSVACLFLSVSGSRRLPPAQHQLGVTTFSGCPVV